MELRDRERFAPGMERQLEALRSALAGGMPRRGWKIGINVPEVLSGLGLRHPGVGWLDGRRAFPSPAELAPRPGARLHVEPEICLHVAAAVPAGASPEVAFHCLAGVSAALEVVDYARPRGGFDEIVAHCMFHDASVAGPVRPLSAAEALGTRWPRLVVSGRDAPPVRADLVPRDPGALVAFVASFLHAYGETLMPGDWILSGSYCEQAVPVSPGSEVHADFGPLGDARLRIVG